jgi:hypothetical protein
MKRTWARIIRYGHRLKRESFGSLAGDERKTMHRYLCKIIEREWNGIPPADTLASRIYFDIP